MSISEDRITTRGRRRLAVAGVLAAGTLVLAGCSSGDQSSDAADPGASPSAATAATAATTPTDEAGAGDKGSEPAGEIPELSDAVFVPSVEVKEVSSGDSVDLQSVVPSDKPVLLWAWAPSCPSCRAEAAGLEAFAAQNQDKLTVIGIGTQDGEDAARDFVSDTGVKTPRMLWDPSFQSWQEMGITAQPTWILVKGNGELVDSWVGGLPEETILSEIGA